MGKGVWTLKKEVVVEGAGLRGQEDGVNGDEAGGASKIGQRYEHWGKSSTG